MAYNTCSTVRINVNICLGRDETLPKSFALQFQGTRSRHARSIVSLHHKYCNASKPLTVRSPLHEDISRYILLSGITQLPSLCSICTYCLLHTVSKHIRHIAIETKESKCHGCECVGWVWFNVMIWPQNTQNGLCKNESCFASRTLKL